MRAGNYTNCSMSPNKHTDFRYAYDFLVHGHYHWSFSVVTTGGAGIGTWNYWIFVRISGHSLFCKYRIAYHISAVILRCLSYRRLSISIHPYYPHIFD